MLCQALMDSSVPEGKIYTCVCNQTTEMLCDTDKLSGTATLLITHTDRKSALSCGRFHTSQNRSYLGDLKSELKHFIQLHWLN